MSLEEILSVEAKTYPFIGTREVLDSNLAYSFQVTKEGILYLVLKKIITK